jgi:hypothetical protein
MKCGWAVCGGCAACPTFYTAVDDTNLDEAVKEWFNNPSSGGTVYGPITGWDVTAVTTWTDFLKKSATAQRSPAPRIPGPPLLTMRCAETGGSKPWARGTWTRVLRATATGTSIMALGLS